MQANTGNGEGGFFSPRADRKSSASRNTFNVTNASMRDVKNKTDFNMTGNMP